MGVGVAMKDDVALGLVSEGEATRIWKRAAELQVEASRHAEAQSRSLGFLTPADELLPHDQISIEEVVSIAGEVGLDAEFVEAAVAELLEQRASGEPLAPDLIERFARRFLGSPPSTLEASLEISAAIGEVYEVLQRLLPSEPYRLRLRETLGTDPLKDGVLVFDAPEAFTHKESYSRHVLMAEDRIKRLYVTLRPGSESCRIRIRGRVDTDPEPAFWMGGLFTAAATVLGTALGAVAAQGFGVSGALLLVPGAAAGISAGLAAYWHQRDRYMRPLIRSARSLTELMSVLEAAVKTKGAFLPRERPLGPDPLKGGGGE